MDDEIKEESHLKPKPAARIHPAVILGIIAAVCVFGYIALDTQPSTDTSTSTTTSTTNDANQSPNTSQANIAPATPSISLSQVQLTNMKLACAFSYLSWPTCLSEGDGDYVLTGEVTNNSPTPFDDIYLTVDLYDCPGDTIDATCTHIGHDPYQMLGVNNGGGTSGTFQPGITTEAQALPFFEGIPPVQGNFLWSYSINQCPANAPPTFDCGFAGYDGTPIPSTP